MDKNMKTKDMNRLIKDIEKWPDKDTSPYRLLNEKGQYSLIGWLGHKAGLTDRYLATNFAIISTRLRTKIAQYYGMEVIEGIRVVFRLGYTINQCMDAARPQDIRDKCIATIRQRAIISDAFS